MVSLADCLKSLITVLYLLVFLPSFFIKSDLALLLALISFPFVICSSLIFTLIAALTNFTLTISLVLSLNKFLRFPFKFKLNSSMSASPTLILSKSLISFNLISVAARSSQIFFVTLRSCPSILS